MLALPPLARSAEKSRAAALPQPLLSKRSSASLWQFDAVRCPANQLMSRACGCAVRRVRCPASQLMAQWKRQKTSLHREARYHSRC